MVSPEILKEFSVFAGLGEAELRRLATIADELWFRREDVVLKEGEPAHTLFLLCDGWVDIVLDAGSGGSRPELAATLSSGDVFGWSAVVEPYVYTATAICASPVKVVGIGGRELLDLFEADPQLGCAIVRKLCQVIASRLRATRLQMTSLFVAR